jgi:hypothetical protein
MIFVFPVYLSIILWCKSYARFIVCIYVLKILLTFFNGLHSTGLSLTFKMKAQLKIITTTMTMVKIIDCMILLLLD